VGDHLSAELFAGWRRRNLEPAQLLALDDHVMACFVCRKTLRATTRTLGALMSLQASLENPYAADEHLAAARLQACFEGHLDPVDRELAEFVQAGFTPLEAIQAATRGAAQFLGREKDCGTVETGKTADLVLLGENPLENIANTRRILAVIRNGNYLDRAALNAMLAKAKAVAAAVPPEK